MSEDQGEKSEYFEVAEEIKEMARLDQEWRTGATGLAESDIDYKNTARMKEIVSKAGWPTISKMGKDASGNAWLLVQHADHDPKFQEKCLDLMQDLPEGEVDLINVAMLTDRVRVNTGRPQLYGTQFWTIDGKVISKDIEDPENVDQRRKQMGLDTLEENKQRMVKRYINKET